MGGKAVWAGLFKGRRFLCQCKFVFDLFKCPVFPAEIYTQLFSKHLKYFVVISTHGIIIILLQKIKIAEIPDDSCFGNFSGTV